MGTWEDKNWDIHSLSGGNYGSMIQAHEKSQDANGGRSKWATQNFVNWAC